MIPTMMITGQMDSGSMAEGFDSDDIQKWANYMLEVNGIDKAFTAEEADINFAVDSRHPNIYGWTRDFDGTQVALVQWGQCLLRPHNPYPADVPILWDFLEHFSKDENGTRYYSASAFEQDDAVILE